MRSAVLLPVFACLLAGPAISEEIVPNILNKTLFEGTSDLQSAGFVFEFTEVDVCTGPVPRFVVQSPSGGEAHDPASVVIFAQIGVQPPSSVPSTITSVSQMHQSIIEAALSPKVAIVSRETVGAPIPSGWVCRSRGLTTQRVLGTSPGSGTPLCPGISVTIQVVEISYPPPLEQCCDGRRGLGCLGGGIVAEPN